MFQTVFMFLAPDHEPCAAPSETIKASNRMLTDPAVSSQRHWKRTVGMCFSVVGNTLGLMLFFSGLFLVLRLVEILLA